MRKPSDDAVEVQLGLRLLGTADDYAFRRKYLGVDRAWELRLFQCLVYLNDTLKDPSE